MNLRHLPIPSCSLDLDSAWTHGGDILGSFILSAQALRAPPDENPKGVLKIINVKSLYVFATSILIRCDVKNFANHVNHSRRAFEDWSAEKLGLTVMADRMGGLRDRKTSASRSARALSCFARLFKTEEKISHHPEAPEQKLLPEAKKCQFLWRRIMLGTTATFSVESIVFDALSKSSRTCQVLWHEDAEARLGRE